MDNFFYCAWIERIPEQDQQMDQMFCKNNFDNKVRQLKADLPLKYQGGERYQVLLQLAKDGSCQSP